MKNVAIFPKCVFPGCYQHSSVLVTTGFIVLGIPFCIHKAVFNLSESRDVFSFSSGGKKSCVENFSLLAVVPLSVFSELSQS